MTYQLHDYQQKLFQQLSAGFRKGEMMVISAGRQTGKSTLNQLYNTNLCKEITLTGQQKLMELTSIWGQPLKEQKYKFSRAKWYTAKMPSAFTTDFQSKDMILWCKQHFGEPSTKVDPWATRWYINWDTINFRDEKDFVFYQLKWS